MTTGFNIHEGSQMLRERLQRFEGYAISDRLGEIYALRHTYQEGQDAARQAEEYLDGAATCGHPAAASWAAERLPIVVRPVSAIEWADALEEATPVLDREP